jgi:hypothetical protein
MPEKTQLFVGIRRKNGQIGYLSESLTIPEFFDLIRPSNEAGNSLIDFSPVIEALHSIHEKRIDQSIREKYNAVFNYWQESKSYSKPEIKLPKFESLSLLSNELISSLNSRIEDSKKGYSHRRIVDSAKNLQVIKTIQRDADAYIDILLCFIHSKASLEIESFQNDVVLSRYCEYLKGVISGLFNDVVEYSAWNNCYRLNDSSLLYHLAFNDNSEINYYTKLLPSFDCSQDLRLSLILKGRAEDSFNHLNERSTKLEAEYRTPDSQEIESARMLRDLLYKISSISELLKQLKEGGVNWNPSKDAVEELKQLVSNNKSI